MARQRGMLTTRALVTDLAALAERDADFAAALAAAGMPPARERPIGFASLLRIIIGQQVSAAAASGIWRRLEAAANPVTPAAIVALELEALKACGLSRQKACYALALSHAVASRALDLEAVHDLDDDAVIAALTAINGIGRWTAEIYLLFAMRRRDVWPAGDLAVAVGTQRLKRLRKRPDPDRLRKLAEPWRPYRSAAALFMWHYYAASLPASVKPAATSAGLPV
jgi:DNA-3-methyladenine glycosylase II